MKLPILVCLAACGIAVAAEKAPPRGEAANDKISINATVYTSKEAIKEQLGSDLDGYFTVVKAIVTPKTGAPVVLSRDDFMMRSDKDGQRSQPFHPSQIAGRSALVISSKGGGGIAAENPGPIWGGYPVGMPGRLGGNSGNVGSAGGEGSAEATLKREGTKKENPLLATLTEKALPETEIKEPATGMLYFQFEGKHKPKDLELVYKGPAGKLSLRFR